MDDPAQNFWMETIRRNDFGDGIRAPFTNKAGVKTPFWELVRYVRDGDVVLHWTTARDGRRPGFVGWSRVDGEPYEVSGLVYSDSSPTEGWEALLRDYTEFSQFVPIDVLNDRIDDVRRVFQETKAAANGLEYFPFAFLSDGSLRPRQGGYLTKVPTALFDVLPEIDSARVLSSPSNEGELQGEAASTVVRIDRRQAREAGCVSDPKVRKAIEMQAVRQAIDYYQSVGYAADDIEDVGTTQPFDLLLSERDRNHPERHVEVKGSQGLAESVELTAGEVDHARAFQPTDLLVVREITWSRVAGLVTTSPGEVTLISNWIPAETSLRATRFRHTVPVPPSSAVDGGVPQ